MKRRHIDMNNNKNILQAMVFSLTTDDCVSWTMKERGRRKVDTFKFCCWKRVPQVPSAAERTVRSILDEMKPDVSMGSSLPKLELSFFRRSMRRNSSLEKAIMLRKIEGERKNGRQRTRWIHSITEKHNFRCYNSRMIERKK